MIPTAFWLTRRMRSMRRPYSQPLLTSVRLLCSSSLQHRWEKQNITNKNNHLNHNRLGGGTNLTEKTGIKKIWPDTQNIIDWSCCCLNVKAFWGIFNDYRIHTVKYRRILKAKYELCTHSSSMLLRPKNAPSMSLVMPFLCIFSDFSESIPLKVRLSTTLILFRFISLKWEQAPVIIRFAF